MIDFLIAAFRLKDEERAGWNIMNVRRPESVADHSWGTALLCWLYAPSSNTPDHAPDVKRAMQMALIHDLAEAETGDIATRIHRHDQTVLPDEKRRRERNAMDRLMEMVPADNGREELDALWEEYEKKRTPTARFVRDMNLCEMCLQALLYEGQRRYPAVTENAPPDSRPISFEGLDEFFETSRPRLTTEVGRRLHGEIERRYRALRGSERED